MQAIHVQCISKMTLELEAFLKVVRVTTCIWEQDQTVWTSVKQSLYLRIQMVPQQTGKTIGTPLDSINFG
jgi:hypothetical protein